MRRLAPALAALALAAAQATALAGCGDGARSSAADGGGTLKITYASFPDHLDPQLSYSVEGWTAMGEVYVPLLTYPAKGGRAGSEVVPGLARAMPKVSADGRTYTLFLRPGLRYSNGRPVRASDFASAVERMFRLNSSSSPLYTSIVGAARFAAAKRGGIAGIETDDRTGRIAIELTRPRGTFANELAALSVAPVPAGTPAEDLSADPPPATGPYMIVHSRPGRGWEYVRNPYWAKANARAMPGYPSGHVDRAVVTVVHNQETQVNDVERGVYDWMQNPVPASRYPQVKSRYEGSQLAVRPSINAYFFWMNTRRAPFDDPRVRRAVNYAIDPAALERIYAGQLVGSQQLLPPAMPGYAKLDLYPHDLGRARALVRAAHPADTSVTVWTDDESPNNEAGEYYEGVLRKLGFETKLRILSADDYFTVIGNRSTPNLDTGWADWFQDYPHPNDFFQPLASGDSIQPTNNTNFSNFDDPALTREIARLGEQQLGPEQERAYAALDRKIMEQAPWAPYGHRTLDTFVSAAVDLGAVKFNPTFFEHLTSFEFK